MGIKNFAKFKGKYEGRVCIILGNGPSINDYDLDDPFFTENITIGSNAIGYRFIPSFYLITDCGAYYRWKKHLFNGVSIPLVGKYASPTLPSNRDIYVVHYDTSKRQGPPNKDIIYNGRTTGCVMLHLVYQMGFQYVFLLGVDGYTVLGQTHFYGTTCRSSSDVMMHRNLKMAVDVFMREKKYLYNLSARSVFTEVPFYHAVPKESEKSEKKVDSEK